MFPVAEEKNWDDWATVLIKIPSGSMSITGGEPTLFPGLNHLINKISNQHRVFITSNISNFKPQLLSSVLKNNVVISASYHPDMINLDEFVNTVIFLHQQGVKISVECVANPENFAKIDLLASICDNHSIDLTIDPIISPDFQYNSQEIAWLEKKDIILRNYGFNKTNPTHKRICMAG